MHILQNILWDQVCPQLNILLISKHKAQAATAAPPLLLSAGWAAFVFNRPKERAKIMINTLGRETEWTKRSLSVSPSPYSSFFCLHNVSPNSTLLTLFHSTFYSLNLHPTQTLFFQSPELAKLIPVSFCTSCSLTLQKSSLHLCMPGSFSFKVLVKHRHLRKVSLHRVPGTRSSLSLIFSSIQSRSHLLI